MPQDCCQGYELLEGQEPPEHVTVDGKLAVIRNVHSNTSTPSLLEFRSVAIAIILPLIKLLLVVPGLLATEN